MASYPANASLRRELDAAREILRGIHFRAVAVDFDGTLADGVVAPATLAALTEARARGVRVILVTGRIMSELRAVFPEVDDHVDAVVAENGAVLVTHGGVRLLAAPVGGAVSAALSGRGVAHRRGRVIVAGAAADEPAALAVVRELGLDCRLVPNRGELMILPAGVTKGSGLREALGDLGLSPHNTIGVGDAENDHSLLDACEVGVAVANAVDALRAHADMVLALPDGPGVADLLLGPLLAGRAHLHPRRWQVMLGAEDGGAPVTLPGSQLNIAVCGGTGEGKSYLAGLVCEQLIRLGYSLVVFDPEGSPADFRPSGGDLGPWVGGDLCGLLLGCSSAMRRCSCPACRACKARRRRWPAPSHALWWPGEVASRDPANLAQAVHPSWAAGLPGRELSPGH